MKLWPGKQRKQQRLYWAEAGGELLPQDHKKGRALAGTGERHSHVILPDARRVRTTPAPWPMTSPRPWAFTLSKDHWLSRIWVIIPFHGTPIQRIALFLHYLWDVSLTTKGCPLSKGGGMGGSPASMTPPSGGLPFHPMM